MTTLISIDPGKASGVAQFRDGVLCACDIYEIAKNEICLFSLDVLVIEIPQVYPVRAWKGDPNDLIEVARIAGVWEGLFTSHNYRHMPTSIIDVVHVRPHEWKGNRPKDVDNAYTLSKLTDAERAVIDKAQIPKSKLHNAIDAVGIGLWYLNRR